VHPFYVRDSRGQRIRVEPASDVKLVDDLDQVVRIREDMRTRVAALTPGEQVFVFGTLGTGQDPELGGDYRGVGLGPVLRSPVSGPMLIASTSPAGRFRARAVVHGTWGLVFVLAVCVLQVLHVPHHARLLAGETVVGTVASTRTFTTKTSKGKTVHHYEVTTEMPGGSVLVQEVDERDFALVNRGAAVRVVRVPGRPGIEVLGDRSTVHLAGALYGLLLLGSMVVGYWLHLRSIRPWYERAVDEHKRGALSAAQEGEPAHEPAIPLRVD
jgi:hypothetical protein